MSMQKTRGRNKTEGWFEVIVGKSISRGQRIFEMLESLRHQAQTPFVRDAQSQEIAGALRNSSGATSPAKGLISV